MSKKNEEKNEKKLSEKENKAEKESNEELQTEDKENELSNESKKSEKKSEKKEESNEEDASEKTLFTININKKNIWQITTVILAVLVLWSFFLRGPMGSGIETVTGNAVAEQQNENAPAQKIEVSAENDAVKGKKEAPVTIVEFSDYECPFCGRFYEGAYKQIETEYIQTGKVKLIFRDFPLDFHQYAQKAAIAAECAGKQGKYWEMHNKLFENQKDLSDENFKKWAKEIGVKKAENFNKCYDASEPLSEIKKDIEDASKYGVTGTPAFFINGRMIVGAQPFDEFKKIIEEELNSK